MSLLFPFCNFHSFPVPIFVFIIACVTPHHISILHSLSLSYIYLSFITSHHHHHHILSLSLSLSLSFSSISSISQPKWIHFLRISIFEANGSPNLGRISANYAHTNRGSNNQDLETRPRNNNGDAERGCRRRVPHTHIAVPKTKDPIAVPSSSKETTTSASKTQFRPTIITTLLLSVPRSGFYLRPTQTQPSNNNNNINQPTSFLAIFPNIYIHICFNSITYVHISIVSSSFIFFLVLPSTPHFSLCNLSLMFLFHVPNCIYVAVINETHHCLWQISVSCSIRGMDLGLLYSLSLCSIWIDFAIFGIVHAPVLANGSIVRFGTFKKLPPQICFRSFWAFRIFIFNQ